MFIKLICKTEILFLLFPQKKTKQKCFCLWTIVLLESQPLLCLVVQCAEGAMRILCAPAMKGGRFLQLERHGIGVLLTVQFGCKNQKVDKTGGSTETKNFKVMSSCVSWSSLFSNKRARSMQPQAWAQTRENGWFPFLDQQIFLLLICCSALTHQENWNKLFVRGQRILEFAWQKMGFCCLVFHPLWNKAFVSLQKSVLPHAQFLGFLKALRNDMSK